MRVGSENSFASIVKLTLMVDETETSTIEILKNAKLSICKQEDIISAISITNS